MNKKVKNKLHYYEVILNNKQVIRIQTNNTIEEILYEITYPNFKSPIFVKIDNKIINVEQIAWINYIKTE